MLLGGVLCAVALTSSGCFLKVLIFTLTPVEFGDLITIVDANIHGTATIASCVTPFEETTTLPFECTYIISDAEGFPVDTTSTAELIAEFGLFGAFIDPLILQMPSGVTNLTGTIDNPADATPPVPLVITTATSFFAQPGTEVFPEAGHVFVIVDFPASVAGTLTTAGTDFTFTFGFRLAVPTASLAAGFPVKAMFTGKVQAAGQTFYPPILPCTTSFASVPAVTIPIGSPVNVLSQLLGLFAQSPGCNNAVYDFTSLGSPPPGGAADHFQCYEARDRRGNLCASSSPQSAGTPCAVETDCGGVVDETSFCVPRGFPTGVRVTLSDQFESGLFDVNNTMALCNPADKNGEGIRDPSTYLRSYRIQAAPGQTQHARRTRLRIENQFHPAPGELLVDTLKPDRLLVPTATSLTQPVPAPDPLGHDVDHYKCYKVMPSRGTTFKRVPAVSILDQFNQPGSMDVVRPTRLCTPVSKNNETIKNPAGLLMCYKVVPVKRLERFDVPGLFLSNQFGSEHVDAGKEAEFCVPSVNLLP
jgi:hypothetical protein